jgi:hypothetical protein
MADEALWLDEGKMQMRGDPKKVVDAYLAQVTAKDEKVLAAATAKAKAEVEEQPLAEPAAGPAEDEDKDRNEVEPVSAFKREKGRWGSREIEITDVDLLGSDGAARHVFETGEPVTVRLKVKSTGKMDDFVFGAAVFNADGVCCYGTNTHIEEFTPKEFSGEGEVRLVLERLQLVEGTYFLDVAAHQRDGYPFDYHRALSTFRVRTRIKDIGIYRPTHRWEFTPNIVMRPPESE